VIMWQGHRIEELESEPIHGNFFMDEDLWMEADAILMNPAEPMWARIRALKLIDRICGEKEPIYNADTVIRVCADLREERGC